MSGAAAGPVDWSETPFEGAELIGRGAMGAVYRALDTRVGRQVALKVHTGHGEKARLRFRREGRLAAALQHPNVVQVHEVFETTRGDVLVCEFVEDARALDEAWRTLDVVGRARLLLDVAKGVGAAHSAGIVHRDLKPENVLVGPDLRARVADFGVAFSEDLDRLTRTGAMVGTPSFMAPEQLAGASPPTAACDVWALGALLYLALTDELPFQGQTMIELISAIARGPGRPQRVALASAPAALRALVEDCLRPAREQRLADGNAVAARLEQCLLDPRARMSGFRGWGVRTGVLGLGPAALVTLVMTLSDSDPLPGASPTPSASPLRKPSASVTPVDSRAAALFAQLEDPEELLCYLAALELTREFPAHARLDVARRVLKRLGGKPLKSLATPDGLSVARLLPREQAIVCLSEEGTFRVWRAGRPYLVRQFERLPRGVRWVRPSSGTVFFSGSWRAPTLGLGRINLQGELGWLSLKGPFRFEVTAFCPLSNGDLLLGGPGGLRLCSPQGAPRAERRLPRGEKVRAIVPAGQGFVAVVFDSKANLTSLRTFDLALESTAVLSQGPGRETVVDVTRSGDRLVVLNEHVAQLSVVDVASGVETVLFSPTIARGDDTIRGVSWCGSETRVLVFYRQDSNSVGRIECWDAVVPGKKHWTLDVPQAIRCEFVGQGPDFATVSLPRRVLVVPLPLEEPL